MTTLVAPERRGGRRSLSVPTFSVVIPAYQAAGTIGEAVASALAQTFPPLEVVVCDDGSTDDLAHALARFEDRILLLRQDHRGCGAAKRTASEAASGDYVVTLDADDVYEPRRLEALGEATAARPDLDLVTTDAVYELDGVVVRRCYGSPSEFPTEAQRRAILQRNFIFGAAAIRRTRLHEVGGFDASLPQLDDWDLWIRLLLSGSVAGLVNEPLYRYRIHRESLSFDRVAQLEARVDVLERVRSNPDLRSDERSVLERAISESRADLRIALAEDAVLHARPGRRRRLATLAIARRVSARTRLKALASIAAPGLAARRLRSIRSRTELLY